MCKINFHLSIKDCMGIHRGTITICLIMKEAPTLTSKIYILIQYIDHMTHNSRYKNVLLYYLQHKMYCLFNQIIRV